MSRFIVVLLGFGLIAGSIARPIVRGPDPMSLPSTWALDIVGALLGAAILLLCRLATHDPATVATER